jgi:hypothetical protein
MAVACENAEKNENKKYHMPKYLLLAEDENVSAIPAFFISKIRKENISESEDGGHQPLMCIESAGSVAAQATMQHTKKEP